MELLNKRRAIVLVHMLVGDLGDQYVSFTVVKMPGGRKLVDWIKEIIPKWLIKIKQFI